MRFGILFQHQLPRAWEPEAEYRLLSEALDQADLADKSGFDYIWQVEHHFLEEYSHSSAPEVFLAAASQRTKRIRLGHGIVQAPLPINHPARIAERVATLDLVSGGRVEFGTGESSSPAELGGFGVSREAKRAMWAETLDAVTMMFTEEPFAGYDGAYLKMPPRNIIPKPLQKPHPPLWLACSRRQTIQLAARSGIGALSYSFAEPEMATSWVTEYYDLLTSSECVPRGFAVNPNVAVVLPMMLHNDEATAIDRGIDGAHFFGYALRHYYGRGPHFVGNTDVWRSFEQNRTAQGFARENVFASGAPLAVQLLQEGLGSLRGAIGTPRQVVDMIARYEAAGVDQIIFAMQVGKNRHEHICESIEIFAREILPRFEERRERNEAAKVGRLAGAIEEALARRTGPRRLTAPYRIDDTSEVATTRRLVRAMLRQQVGQLRTSATKSVHAKAQAGATHIIRGASVSALERTFGSRNAQYLVFAAMASRFDASKAQGFKGIIRFELEQRDGTQRFWDIEVRRGKARARCGDTRHAALTIRIPLIEFIKVITGITPFLPLVADGVATMKGDLGVATRLPEMFGAPSAY